jgi:hypothetical protein
MSEWRVCGYQALIIDEMCRVATSLCSLLFDSPKAHDTLLLMTILSTDLRSLKRRGYNGLSNLDLQALVLLWLNQAFLGAS